VLIFDLLMILLAVGGFFMDGKKVLVMERQFSSAGERE
jgi:hypothetical protein